MATSPAAASSAAAAAASSAPPVATRPAAAASGPRIATIADLQRERPPAAAQTAMAEEEDAEFLSDVASDGEHSAGMHDDVELEVDTDEAVAQLVGLGFPESVARDALKASHGNVDAAAGLLLGD
mmetsp:Transcript_50851/g.88702  ORF Transcript_50851/g.88702 Transcript_50851/m.88702 type:complete len:125 (-) Transcript_50851:32-406(-)